MNILTQVWGMPTWGGSGTRDGETAETMTDSNAPSTGEDAGTPADPGTPGGVEKRAGERVAGSRGSITVHPLAEHAVAGLPWDDVAIRVLEESFAALKPSAGRLTQEFYRRLFELHPHLRRMFPTDIAAQEKKLADTLTAVIEGLRSPGAVRQKVQELGRYHAEKGVVAGQYAVVSRLLLECMADAAGSAWTQEIHSEWERALEQISAIMIGASGR